MPPIRLDVNTPSRPYTITIGEGVLASLPAILDSAKAPARRFIVSSLPIWRMHGPLVAAASDTEPILVPDGERHDQWQRIQHQPESEHDQLYPGRSDHHKSAEF